MMGILMLRVRNPGVFGVSQYRLSIQAGIMVTAWQKQLLKTNNYICHSVNAYSGVKKFANLSPFAP